MADPNTRLRLLQWEVNGVQKWLDAFEGASPRVGLAASRETLWVRDFPLPDSFSPDRISLAMIVKHFPEDPPKGIYLLSDPDNASLLSDLRARFNIFQDRSFHGAPTIEGTEWICVGYLDGWRYDIARPHRGDNIHKMLLEFWRLLEQA